MVVMMTPQEYFEKVRKPKSVTEPLKESEPKVDYNMYMVLAILFALAVLLWE